MIPNSLKHTFNCLYFQSVSVYFNVKDTKHNKSKNTQKNEDFFTNNLNVQS